MLSPSAEDRCVTRPDQRIVLITSLNLSVSSIVDLSTRPGVRPPIAIPIYVNYYIHLYQQTFYLALLLPSYYTNTIDQFIRAIISTTAQMLNADHHFSTRRWIFHPIYLNSNFSFIHPSFHFAFSTASTTKTSKPALSCHKCRHIFCDSENRVYNQSLRKIVLIDENSNSG